MLIIFALGIKMFFPKIIECYGGRIGGRIGVTGNRRIKGRIGTNKM